LRNPNYQSIMIDRINVDLSWFAYNSAAKFTVDFNFVVLTYSFQLSVMSIFSQSL